MFFNGALLSVLEVVFGDGDWVVYGFNLALFTLCIIAFHRKSKKRIYFGILSVLFSLPMLSYMIEGKLSEESVYFLEMMLVSFGAALPLLIVDLVRGSN